MNTLDQHEINTAIENHPKSNFKELSLGDTRGMLLLSCDVDLPKTAWKLLFKNCVLSLSGKSAFSIKAGSEFRGRIKLNNVDGKTARHYQVLIEDSRLWNIDVRNEPIHLKNNHMGQLTVLASDVSVGVLQMSTEEQINITCSSLAKINVVDSDISYSNLEADQPGSLISGSLLSAAKIDVNKVYLTNQHLTGIHYEGRHLANNAFFITVNNNKTVVGQLMNNEYMVWCDGREVNLGVWEQHYVRDCDNFVLQGLHEVYLKAFKRHRDIVRLNQ